MADVIWPLDLPESALWGWTQVLDANTVPGVVKKGRRKYTVAQDSFAISTILSGSQYASFMNFWKNGTLDGSLPFVWKRPWDNTTSKFIVTTPPSPQHMVNSASEIVVRVSLVIKETT